MSSLGDLIVIGRKAQGLTQAELGTVLGLSQVAVARYENADRLPDAEVLERLAVALGVTVKFLEHGDRFRGALGVEAHMRRQKTTKVSLWKRAEAFLNVLRVHASFLLEEVSLHSQQEVPSFDPEFTTPSDAARLVRAQWRMPIGPVSGLIRWMEAAGCLIFEEDLQTPRIDGLSQWVSGHPVILLNTQTSPERRRLTCAHELGHLVLHAVDVTEDMEAQANEFAAEFLMPESAIRHELRHNDLATLVALKREWGVSMQALFVRADRFGMVTPAAKTRFWKGLNARGWKTKEPGSDTVPFERPELPASIGASLRARGFDNAHIDRIAGYQPGSNNPFRPRDRRLQAV